jgi:hypothetical protein
MKVPGFNRDSRIHPGLIPPMSSSTFNNLPFDVLHQVMEVLDHTVQSLKWDENAGLLHTAAVEDEFIFSMFVLGAELTPISFAIVFKPSLCFSVREEA